MSDRQKFNTPLLRPGAQVRADELYVARITSLRTSIAGLSSRRPTNTVCRKRLSAVQVK